MATLNTEQLIELRREYANGSIVNHTKAQINNALQQIENWFEDNRISLGNAITGGFTNAEKKRLVKYWLKQKFGRE